MNHLAALKALAIGRHPSTIDNLLFDCYGKITAIQKVKSFLMAGNNVKCGSQSQLNNINHLKSTILVDTNMDTISKVRTRYAAKQCFLLRTSRIFRHVKQTTTRARVKNYFLPDLVSFSRQVAITQAEKLVFSLDACFSISSIKSWGKRIFFSCDLLFLLPVAIVCSFINKYKMQLNNNKKELTCLHTKIYSIYTPSIFIRLKKAIPRSVPPLSRDLTKPLKLEVMIMANRYDSAHLRARQFKLFKFYDLSTIQILQVTAATERDARKQLGKKSLIFISRRNLYPVIERSVTRGGYNYA